MIAQPLGLFTVFHLNVAYSSIEEEQRPEVVRRCYWPMLRLAREHDVPVGLEIPGYTLETIARIDAKWIRELRGLLDDGRCELIGSGYAQLIGPLVPAAVNAANLRIGHATYDKILGRRPCLALVNEQAYSAGLVGHYVDAGYRALLMERDNAASHHPEWDARVRYLPQRACGPRGEEIPLLWSESIAFQKFQRYAHGEMQLDEYVAYLAGHAPQGDRPRSFALYANDVEIFDFRPGRYHTEAPLAAREWDRIGRLFDALRSDARFDLVGPSRVLCSIDAPGAGQRLHLESAEMPVPVKKQGKYNVVRWAVTGRDDLAINTACWRLYEALCASKRASDAQWRELCYLWSSDFRTHITKRRWAAYKRRLAAFEKKMCAMRRASIPKATKRAKAGSSDGSSHLELRTDRLRVRLNARRGLAIDGVWLDGQQGPPLLGTLPHGFYDDIALGADWYTGHVTLDAPARHKVTDLSPVVPSVEKNGSGTWTVRAAIPTALGPVHKTITISDTIAIAYRFAWKEVPIGSLRLGHVTLHPASFDRDSLYYAATSGGTAPDKLPLAGTRVDHGASVSSLVSARCALGITDGRVEIGDARRRVIVEVDKTVAALVGMIAYRETRGTWFCRLSLSAGEMDDTRRVDAPGIARHVDAPGIARHAGRKREDLQCRVTLRFA